MQFKKGQTPWNKGKKMASPCEICGISVVYSKYGQKIKICSNICTNRLRSILSKKAGCNPPNRLGKRVEGAKHRYKMKNGYIALCEGDTPRIFQYEHRAVMEGYLGRKLNKREQVHHINGIKTDNRTENLLLIDIAEHTRLHHKERTNTWQDMM